DPIGAPQDAVGEQALGRQVPAPADVPAARVTSGGGACELLGVERADEGARCVPGHHGEHVVAVAPQAVVGEFRPGCGGAAFGGVAGLDGQVERGPAGEAAVEDAGGDTDVAQHPPQPGRPGHAAVDVAHEVG